MTYGHRVQASSSTASRCTSGGKDETPVTRPLTYNKSNRDYNSQQHNNYNRDYNRDYNNSYRNYGNNNYHQQQQSNNINHHRAFQNNLNSANQQLNQSQQQIPPPTQQQQQPNSGGTLGARPFEANNQQHYQINKPITGQQTNVNLNNSNNSITNQLHQNDKPFKKWVPPSVTDKNENLITQEDRNNVVFRKVRGILNKITPDKFNKLSDELLLCELDSPAILKGVVVLIFNKALEEPKYSSMYAQLCRKISESAKNFETVNSDYVKQTAHDNTFCKYLLAKCQHEFNNRLQASEAFGDGPLNEEEEEKRDQVKKMMLGNIKFICELGKQNLADEGILHRCIVQLCKKKTNIKHTVEDFECLCQIMKTVGKLLDTERGKSLMDQYFSRMEKYANGNELPLRIKFKIQDVLDLRRNKWVPRNVQMIDQNPRTLGQIREEATKDYSFLQPGGSLMGNFAAQINQFNGASGLQFNSRGSSHYGQQQNVHQLSGQRALDDLYGANLPTSFNASNASTTSSQTSFDNGSNNRNEHNNSRYESNYSNTSNNQPPPPNQQQPPRRIISQQPSFLTNSNNNNNNPRNQNINNSNNSKLNDMSSSSSNSSSLREDEQQQQQQQQQMNQRNQNYNNRNYSDEQRPNYNNQNYRQNQQQNNYHDSRPHYNNQQNNNRYNNYNNQQNNYNNNYQNRNNSGERMNQMNNKMGNLNLRDNNPVNQRSNERELPPRFQKMQQQQQQQQQNQQPHRNYNQQQDSYNNQRNQQQNHHNYNNNNQGNQYGNHQQQQYQQRNQNNYNNNNFNNQQQMNNQPGNQITNQKINFNLLDSKEKEISLRPAKNFFSPKPPVNLGNPASQQQRNDFNDQSPVSQTDNPLNRNQLNKPSTPIKQLDKPSTPVVEPPAEQKEDYFNKVNESLSKLIKKEQDEEVTIKQIKELKTTKASKNQLLVHIMKYGLDKSEQERELITNIVTKFKKDDFCTSDDYKQAFKQILSSMKDLESDVPKIKSFVSIYIAHGISEEIIDLKEAFDLTVKTIYYPLFLLCLQYLGQNKDQQLLIKKFNQSKLDLMLALPEIDRNKERLSEVLRDRQLGFLYPLLRIESELMKQVNSGNDISPKSLYSWIKENVDSELQKTEGFIITLFTCIAKYVTEKTKTQIEEIEKEEGSNTDKRIIELQKDILSKYAQIFQSFLLEKQNLQLALLYALQAYCHKLQFPKGMIFRWFIMLYDLEIVDGEVFLIWKEEVNDEYPDKGKALFQVNTWLNWLEKAEQDDDDEDEE